MFATSTNQKPLFNSGIATKTTFAQGTFYLKGRLLCHGLVAMAATYFEAEKNSEKGFTEPID